MRVYKPPTHRPEPKRIKGLLRTLLLFVLAMIVTALFWRHDEVAAPPDHSEPVPTIQPKQEPQFDW